MEILNSLPEETRAALLAELEQKYVERDKFETLNRTNSEQFAELKNIKKTKAEIEAQAEQAKQEAMARNGDVESLRKSFEDKLNEKQAMIDKYMEEHKSKRVNEVATQFTKEYVSEDEFIRDAFNREFASRLDIRDEELVVLDSRGNLTALTIDDLKQEFLSNSKYKGVLIGSKAKGGGTTGNPNAVQAGSKKALSDIPLNDKAARIAAIKSKLKQ